jgi:hypothetical protein
MIRCFVPPPSPCAGTTSADTLKYIPVSLPPAPSLAREGSALVVPAQGLITWKSWDVGSDLCRNLV